MEGLRVVNYTIAEYLRSDGLWITLEELEVGNINIHSKS